MTTISGYHFTITTNAKPQADQPIALDNQQGGAFEQLISAMKTMQGGNSCAVPEAPTQAASRADITYTASSFHVSPPASADAQDPASDPALKFIGQLLAILEDLDETSKIKHPHSGLAEQLAGSQTIPPVDGVDDTNTASLPGSAGVMSI